MHIGQYNEHLITEEDNALDKHIDNVTLEYECMRNECPMSFAL